MRSTRKGRSSGINLPFASLGFITWVRRAAARLDMNAALLIVHGQETPIQGSAIT